jgi:hypothetical protein
MKMLPIGIETDPKLSWAISILTMIMLFSLEDWEQSSDLQKEPQSGCCP